MMGRSVRTHIEQWNTIFIVSLYGSVLLRTRLLDYNSLLLRAPLLRVMLMNYDDVVHKSETAQR